MGQPTSNIITAFKKDNLSILVDEYIKDKILRGLYKEGDRVLETDLADELGISRGPVREGIKISEQAGILTVEPRKGAYVTKFDEHDIQEVFEVRVLLENSILESLIINKAFTDKDYEFLNNIIEDMLRAVNSTVLDKDEITFELNKKDIEFHQYIWRKSGNRRKEKVLDQFYFQLRLAMLYDTRATQNLSKTATDHYRIIDCLKTGDLKNCRQALIDHIMVFYDYDIEVG